MSARPPGDTPPDAVRAACAAVAAAATLVRIDTAGIADYAAALPLDTLPAATFDPRYHFRGDPGDTVAYVLTLDAINFGSGYFPRLRQNWACIQARWRMCRSSTSARSAPTRP